MAEPYVPYSQGTFNPYTGAVYGAPPTTGGRFGRLGPDAEYSLTNVYQTWRMITQRPEYQAMDAENKLGTLERFVENTTRDYGTNPHGLRSLRNSQRELIIGQREPEKLEFAGEMAQWQYHTDLGKEDFFRDKSDPEAERAMRGRVDSAYEEYVRNGDIPHSTIMGGIGAAITHLGASAVEGGLVGGAGGLAVGAATGPGAAATGAAGATMGAVAGGLAEGDFNQRGRSMELRYFSNLDSGMEPDEAWEKAHTAAVVGGHIVGAVSAFDPTRMAGRAVARGALGALAQGAMAKGAATSGLARFALQRAGQGVVVGGLGAGAEAVDYAQSRALGNVDDTRLMGSLGERMLFGAVGGAAIHGTMPLLGKAYKGAKVFGGKDFKGKGWAAKYNQVFAEENFAGAIGHLQLLADDARAGKRPGGAEGLDVMEPSRFGHRVSPDEATKVAMDIWNVITDGTEPIKFKVVDDGTGQKVVAGDVDAQYSRAKGQIDAYLNMFRWDKGEGQRVTLNHEASHAFMDTLPTEVVDGLHTLWKAETENKSGPLYRKGAEGGGELRPKINPDAPVSFREWFAEHMAIANDSWAKTKLDAAEVKGRYIDTGKNPKATSMGMFELLSGTFREKSEKVGRRLGLRPEGFYSTFRDFMDSGDAYLFGHTDKGRKAYNISVIEPGAAAAAVETAVANWRDRQGIKYPTRKDLKNAADWAAIGHIEGRKRGQMEIAEIDSPEAPARMSETEVSGAQERVAAIDAELATKGKLSRKERGALKKEKREIEARVGQQFLEQKSVPGRTKLSERQKAERRDAVEFSEDPKKYQDTNKPGGVERTKIAREARKSVATKLRKKDLAKKAAKTQKKKDDKMVAQRGYKEVEGGQLEFETRGKPKDAVDVVARKIDDGEDVTYSDLESIRAGIEEEVKAKVKAKRASEPRLKGEKESGELGALGGDEVEFSRGRGSKALNDKINAAKLPEGPVEALKAVTEAEGQVSGGSTEAGFFGKAWPGLLRKTGLQVGSKKDPGIRQAVDLAISDVQVFLKDNPRYIDFYNKDWKLARQHLDDAFDETFGHKLSEDEFLFYRVASGLNSSNTKLKPNIGDAVNFLHLWVEEGNLDSFKMGLSEKGNLVIKESPFEVSGTTNGIKVRSMLAVETLVKEFNGNVGKAVDYLQEAIPVRDLHAFNREMGYKGAVGKIGNIKRIVQQATGQQELIPRMFIFGQKVGAYTLNAIGDSRYNTIDVWESRFARSYFKGMFKNFGLPENVAEHKLFSRFTEIFHERFQEITGQKWDNSALQAIRWFYMIDAAKRVGYKHASTNDTISGYTKEKLDQRRGRDEASGGRGDETVGRGGEDGGVQRGGDAEFSRGRGTRKGVEGEGAARRFPERAAQSAGASRDLKPIRESRPDIATYEPQTIAERVDTMESRSNDALMDSVNGLEDLISPSKENWKIADALELLKRKRQERDRAPDQTASDRVEAEITTIFEKLSKAGTSMGQLISQFRLFKGIKAEDRVALLNNYLLHRGLTLKESQKAAFKELVRVDAEAVSAYEAALNRSKTKPTDENIRAVEDAEDIHLATFHEVHSYAKSMVPRDLDGPVVALKTVATDLVTAIQGNLLTGVSLMRNTWGNYARPFLEVGARTIASPVDWARAKVTGGKRLVTVAPIAESAALMRNTWRAVKRVPRIARRGSVSDSIMGEKIRGFQPVRSLVQLFTGDLPVDAKTGKVRHRDRAAKMMEVVLGSTSEPMLRGLLVMDEVAKSGMGAMRVAEELKLRKIKRGTREYAEAVLGENREINTARKEAALEATYQEDSKAATAALAVERVFGPLGKAAMRILLSPYIKTPVNLAMQTLPYAYPPAALAEGFYHGALKKGKPDIRRAQLAAGKFIVGLSIGVAAEWLLEDDIITGGPDSSRKVNKMRGQSGMGYFRINMDGLLRKWNGGDGSYQAGDETVRLDFLGILGGALAVRAEAKRLQSRTNEYAVKSETTLELHLDQLTSVTSLGRYAVDQTMLKGASELLEALQSGNYARWHASIFNTALAANPYWANNFVQWRASEWKYKPNIYDPDEATNLANVIKYKNGDWDDLPVVRDIWGRAVQQTPEGQDPFLYHMLDLRKPQKVTDAARVRLLQLFDATGNTDIVPSWPTPTISLPGGGKVTLPPRLYDGYVEAVQGAKLQAFGQLVSDPRWYRVNEDTAVEMVRKRMTKFGTVAKQLWLRQNAREVIAEYQKLLAQERARE